MLLAVEGGGFFSSSASGYSKGLTLLLLGQKNEDDKPMRVSPWNQYQLVDQEPDPDPDPDLQLASVTKNRLSCGCSSFVCFGRASSVLDSPSHLKVGPAQNQDVFPRALGLDKGKDHMIDVEDDNGNVIKVPLKSSLKRPSDSDPVHDQKITEHDEFGEIDNDITGHIETRKVQWTDACGSELAEIREFEPSETGRSDDDFDNGIERSCSCTIM